MGVIFGKKIGPYRPDLERVSRLGKLFFNIFKLPSLIVIFGPKPGQI